MSPEEADTLKVLYSAQRARQRQIAQQIEQMQLAIRDDTYAAIHASIANRHNFAVFITPIRWLPITAALLALFGESSSAEFVQIKNAAAHLTNERPKEAATISDALRTDKAEILYYGQRYKGTRRYEIVVKTPAGLTIFLPFEFITEGTVDSCVAPTAFKIDGSEIRRRVRKGWLRPV